MPRRMLTFAEGEYYHIYNRGAARGTLFGEADNYEYVLRKSKEVGRAFNLAIIAYCLLPNHYHLLIRQDGRTAAGELPKRVFGGYSRAVQKRYGWSGTLFEGRYQAKRVDSDSYLRHLCAYIHANPVKHGLVDRPQQWLYSNYLEWLGLRNGTLVDSDFVEDMFGDGRAYETFVQDYLDTWVLPEELSYLA